MNIYTSSKIDSLMYEKLKSKGKIENKKMRKIKGERPTSR